MSREIYIASLEQKRIHVLMEGGRVLDCFMTTMDGAKDVGAIYLAKAERILKGAGGMFVNIGGETAFLRTKQNLKPGALFPVQIVQYANGEKPMRVSEQIDYKGRYAVLTPDRSGINQSRKAQGEIMPEEIKARLANKLGDGCGMILRTEAEFASLSEIEEDIDALIARKAAVDSAKEIGLISPIPVAKARALAEWGYGKVHEHDKLPSFVCDALAEVLAHPITLPSGGEVYVEPTRAMISVDVNTGSDVGVNAAREANREALVAIVHHLKIMGWGGQLVIDFAPMPINAQKPTSESFAKIAREFRLGFTPRGFGPLGLMEGVVRYERMALPRDLVERI